MVRRSGTPEAPPARHARPAQERSQNQVTARRLLADKKIRMISQGASEINISFVIDESDVPVVVSRLHQAFFSEVDPEVFA